LQQHSSSSIMVIGVHQQHQHRHQPVLYEMDVNSVNAFALAKFAACAMHWSKPAGF
jgi:hypothetical protein